MMKTIATIATFADGSELKLLKDKEGMFTLYRLGGNAGMKIFIKGSAEELRKIASNLLGEIGDPRSGLCNPGEGVE